ncbi:hypothetical protein ACHQM5_013943 [Ranunculus cassubicifolius]
MAASANPSGGGGGEANTNNNNNNSNNNGVVSNGNRKSSGDNSGTVQAMKHNPGISAEWTAQEQAIFDQGLIKFASETPLMRYALIADQLNDKTLRDVALRCRWITKKESGKRRKDDMTRRNKDKKEKTADPSGKSSSGHIAMRPNVPPYAPPMIPMDTDDGISLEAIGGPTGHLLAQNAQVFEQISANFATFQIQENANLFRQTRDNILTIMNELNNDMPGIMKQMPLPVKLNDELANTLLGPGRPIQS